MATKKLEEENDILRSDIEELKSQLYKMNEDLKTQTNTASKAKRTAEANQVRNAIERTHSEEQAEAVTFYHFGVSFLCGIVDEILFRFEESGICNTVMHESDILCLATPLQ